jgi:HEAT repeat protein
VALEASEDFDPDVREKAVRLLAARGDQRATARLLLFCAGLLPLAAAALNGVIRIADQRAVPALRQVFLNSNERRIRPLAGQALARSSRRAGLLHPGWWLTLPQLRAVAWVLGDIGDTTSAPGPCRMLAHRDELVRARAASSLGKIADPEAAHALRAALGDISPRVRASAATAIGLRGQGSAGRGLDVLDDGGEQSLAGAEVVDQHAVAGPDLPGQSAQARVADTVPGEVVDRALQQGRPAARRVRPADRHADGDAVPPDAVNTATSRST